MSESSARTGFRRPVAPAVASTARDRRSVGAGEIVLTIALCLLAGHLAISAYFGSIFINFGGVIVVAVILGRVLFVKRDVFAFVLIVFFCSGFRYANNQGGLFNLVAFVLGALYLVFQSNVRETGARDPLVNTLAGILFAGNTIGLLVRNPMPAWAIFLEWASFTAFLLMFVIASHLHLTEARLKKLLVVSAVMITYNFLASLNQHYALIQIDTPLLGLTSELFYATSNSFGMFGSASASAQWAVMMIALLAPLIAATASKKALDIRPLVYVPVLVLCGLTIVLANMRAAAIEVVLIVAFYFMIFSTLYRRFFKNSKYLNMASAGAAVFMLSAGVWIGLENIESDFRSVQVGSVSALESGAALNRREPWMHGLRVLEEGSWWVGYGHGNDKSNLLAWGGRSTGMGEIVGGGHFHNLYLALPTLYGWFGAIAYVWLFLLVVFRLLGAVRRYSLGSLTVVACLGFLMSLAAFVLDEIKSGNAVQTINYGMIAWIWLGLGLAAWRTLRAEVAAARMRRAPPEEPDEPVAAEEPPPEEPLPEEPLPDGEEPAW